MAGGIPTAAPQLAGGYLTGRALIFPLSLIISLFFLWGFSYGLLDVLNKHFQTVLGISRLESTGLQVMYFGGGYLLYSPIAAEVLKRRGYKQTILMGLSLYSLGAILFWPVAKSADSSSNGRAVFGGFCACTLVIACGLATLETAANSYAVVIGKPESASARLQFCQSWNGVASFIGPLIASKYFFSGANQNSLTNVQYVYLAVSCAGAAVAVLFFFARLPEIPEAVIEDEAHGQTTQGSFWKQYNMWFAFGAQLCYVGAQVTIATFFINYAHENGGISTSKASTMLSYALITFTVGRFFATALAMLLSSGFIMVVYTCCAIALTAYVSAGHGAASVGVLITIFFFEAPMYPTIFAMGTKNLGRHTRRGAGVLVMGVSGGAIFPPIQGAIADAKSTRISYLVPMIGFVYVLGYVAVNWVRDGTPILAPKASETTVSDSASVKEKDGAIIEQHEKKADDWA
ncbi:major facilitator superfamily domain-containing protein [Ilyonectria robusta]|uniref:major facilitator superfamily domain-containing protein n=1 Tax=Ilyonectria robusta TaxID=1079257 RepID=UPI001E8CA7EB|nr:major facilitator superfamily domain-containing protein [Ilyonectria robusta]KAH8685023.1 major facilitator superfamily domain-containing protein [Ilyonectria robusta]